MPDLLMIVPTRGRPHNTRDLWNAWTHTTTGHADLLFAVDADDPTIEDYFREFQDMPGILVWITPSVEPRVRMVGVLNASARAYAHAYRYLGFMGDDHRPRTPGWDQRFTECLSGGTGIVYGNDLLQGEEIPTAVAMTSNIILTLGYMAPPAMTHLCVDLCWKDWGQAINRITYLPDVILEHLHPANGKAPNDAGYEDANHPDRVVADANAYYTYRDTQPRIGTPPEPDPTVSCLVNDVTKLRALL